MVDLFISGVARTQIAEQFDISLSSVKGVLRSHGARRYPDATP